MTRPILACKGAREPAIERASLPQGRLPCDVLGGCRQAPAALQWVNRVTGCMLEQPELNTGPAQLQHGMGWLRRGLAVPPLSAPASALGRKRARQAAGALSRERAALSPGPSMAAQHGANFWFCRLPRVSKPPALCQGRVVQLLELFRSAFAAQHWGCAASFRSASGRFERLLMHPSRASYASCAPPGREDQCAPTRRLAPGLPSKSPEPVAGCSHLAYTSNAFVLFTITNVGPELQVSSVAAAGQDCP